VTVTTAVPARQENHDAGLVSSVNTPYLHYWVSANKLWKNEYLKTANGAVAVVVGGSTPKRHDGWMWDLTVPGNNDHDFYVVAGQTTVLVHNCGSDDATPLVSGKPNDAYFATQDEAKAAALQAYGVSDTSTVEVRTMYGKNPNLIGPNGEPWYQFDAINDDGDLVTIDNHANGHYFEDNNTYALPHYHGPDGSHFFYGQRIW
jgi:hypothetical protein